MCPSLSIPNLLLLHFNSLFKHSPYQPVRFHLFSMLGSDFFFSVVGPIRSIHSTRWRTTACDFGDAYGCGYLFLDSMFLRFPVVLGLLLVAAAAAAAALANIPPQSPPSILVDTAAPNGIHNFRSSPAAFSTLWHSRNRKKSLIPSICGMLRYDGICINCNVWYSYLCRRSSRCRRCRCCCLYMVACVSSLFRNVPENPAEGKYEILLLEIGNSVSTVYEVY